MTNKGVTTKEIKNYNQSPLPFQGQKRNFVKMFRESLNQYDESFVFVDLFGGSGLLSHNAKATYPAAQVIYNDYDNFSKRLKAVNKTNKILRKLRAILEDHPRNKRILGETRKEVLQVLIEADKQGYVDYITLSSSLKFSMNYSDNLKGFTNSTLYNTVRKSDYTAEDYLRGVQIVKCDYKKIFEQYKNKPRVVFLVDPPYLSTDSSTYASDGYWKLRDYLDVLQVLTDQNYFYFTSNKSQIVELCEWISSVSITANPFQNATRQDVQTNSSYNSKYTDIMYHYKK